MFELLALFEKIEHQVLAFVGGGSDLGMDNEGSDKNRMFALMRMANGRIPMGGKKNNGGGGDDPQATITGGDKPHKGWGDLKSTPKITNDHLIPKDK